MFFFFNNTPKKNWQIKLINNILSKEVNSEHVLSNLYNSDLINIKKENAPKTLYKFYAPTIENISDVQNRLLWLASPDSFNDPYDCSLSFNYEDFREYYTIRSFKNNSLFSEEEKNMIYSASNSKHSYYNKSFNSIYYDLKEKHSKSKSFNNYNRELNDATLTIKNFTDSLMSDKYRIACFSSYSWDKIKFEQLMWAHYAKSHKGFCVKYDLSSLFDENIKDENLFSTYNTEHSSYCLYPYEQRRLMINGFFPVLYSSRNVILPKSLCYAIVKNSCNKRQETEITKKVLLAVITKSLPWQYEQEWSLIVDNQLCNKVENKIPFPFAKEIIVGINASKELKRLLKDLALKLEIDYKVEYI